MSCPENNVQTGEAFKNKMKYLGSVLCDYYEWSLTKKDDDWLLYIDKFESDKRTDRQTEERTNEQTRAFSVKLFDFLK